MNFSDWVFRGSQRSYDKKIRILATEVLPPEKWGHTSTDEFSILRNYIMYTFEKLWMERCAADLADKNYYVYEDDTCSCFNTGLLDKHLQRIYFCCKSNHIPNKQKWIFDNFYNEFSIGQLGQVCIPPSAVTKLHRPNYFEDPSKLVFDVNLPIIPQWNHIIDDPENFARIPDQIRENGPHSCRTTIEGAIALTKKRIDVNYKTAIPQWYRGRIQLLVPLYLTNPNTPDLALVLSLADDRSKYYAHTCLTIDMAYNNARLIAKPDSLWLLP